MSRTAIDLNCDIGEIENGSDDKIVDLVSTVNISCGVHAGSLELTRKTVNLAREHGVALGAHPGVTGEFGRSDERIDVATAYFEVQRQLLSIVEIARDCRANISHVKPHGALYNQAESHQELAGAIVAATLSVLPETCLYGLAGGQLIEHARARGLKVVGEFFADRSYSADGRLTPRSATGSILTDPQVVAGRVLQAVVEGTVTAVNGDLLEIDFQSICVHGDTAQSLAMVNAVRQALVKASISIESCL